MSITKQMNKFYAVMGRAATELTGERKPNTRVIRKMDELRRVARRFKATHSHSTTLHPSLTARLLRVSGQY
jgi:hypothetical protein